MQKETEMMRRIPIYVLLDTSRHMQGDGIESARRGIAALITDLQGNPQALETAWISVITFAESAKQFVPLTELLSFSSFDFGSHCQGQCYLGEAFRALDQCLATEVRKTTVDSKGDFRPIAYLLSNGTADDSWTAALDEIRGKVTLIACQAGSVSSGGVLPSLTETVIQLSDTSPRALGAFLKWVSCSITSDSIPAPPSESLQFSTEPRYDPQQLELSGTDGGNRSAYLELVRSLIDHGADVETKDGAGSTPLNLAVELDNTPLIEVLLEKGADINAVDKEGRTPLLLSIELDRPAIAIALIEEGADTSIQDRNGRSPLQLAMARCSGQTAAQDIPPSPIEYPDALPPPPKDRGIVIVP